MEPIRDLRGQMGLAKFTCRSVCLQRCAARSTEWRPAAAFPCRSVPGVAAASRARARRARIQRPKIHAHGAAMPYAAVSGRGWLGQPLESATPGEQCHAMQAIHLAAQMPYVILSTATPVQLCRGKLCKVQTSACMSSAQPAERAASLSVMPIAMYLAATITCGSRRPSCWT